MAISNGYCTLAELKEYLEQARTYSAASISFAESTKKISDSAYGLKRFQTGDLIQVSGSADNDGYYTIATGNVAKEIVVVEALVDELVGATVTITQMDDLPDDVALERAVGTVSRYIDGRCGRRFYQKSGTVRYYTAEDYDELEIADLVSVDSLETDENADRVYERTWVATDYDLEPYNAATDGWPYTYIHVAPSGNYSFPTTRKGVKVTGTWGWPSVPEPIQEACLLLAAQIFMRKGAVFGIVGGGEMGEVAYIARRDPHVRMLLERYSRVGMY